MTAINGARLWSRLMEMAKIGATPQGGVSRLALTDLDIAGRQLFISWCEQTGMRVRHDAAGNLFARRRGSDEKRAPVAMGSHLDSQPTGGKFDGVFGVLAALEVVESLNDKAIETAAPVDIIVWTNEEGARFSPAMMGSGVFAGEFTLDYARSRKDKDGVSVGDELDRLSYGASDLPDAYRIGAFLEAHIEQGPILEREGLDIGVVTGVQGIRWYDVMVAGKENHAGPFPMGMRRDPVRASAALIERLYTLVDEAGEDARMTIGEITAMPGSRNTVPGAVRFSLDLRHPDPAALDRLSVAARKLVGAVDPCSATIDEIWHSPPVRFDETCIGAVREAVRKTGYKAREMVSGAGHDAVYVSRVAPTAMIFTPCKDGLSHNEAEHASPEELAKGADVLFHAALSLSN